MVAHTTTQKTSANYIMELVKQFRSWEDILLLWSVPALIGALLLSAISSAIGEVLFIASVLNLLTTMITLVTACILFLEWIDSLQFQSRSFIDAMNEETTRRFLGVSAVCLVLLTLIVITASGNGSQGVLQMVVFTLLGWALSFTPQTLFGEIKEKRSAPML